MSDHEALLTIARLIMIQYYTSTAPSAWYQDDYCRNMIYNLELFCKENEPDEAGHTKTDITQALAAATRLLMRMYYKIDDVAVLADPDMKMLRQFLEEVKYETGN